MAITRKPVAAVVNVDALIQKGGGVPRAVDENRMVYVQLRLPEQLIAQIDKSLATRRVKTPRHTWLLEAIHEKLERGV